MCNTHSLTLPLGFSSCTFHVSRCGWKCGTAFAALGSTNWVPVRLLTAPSCLFFFPPSSPSAHRADDAKPTDPGGAAGEVGRPERVAVGVHWEVSKALIVQRIHSHFDHFEKWSTRDGLFIVGPGGIFFIFFSFGFLVVGHIHGDLKWSHWDSECRFF